MRHLSLTCDDHTIVHEECYRNLTLMAVLNSPSLLRSWGVERQKEERAKANSIKL